MVSLNSLVILGMLWVCKKTFLEGLVGSQQRICCSNMKESIKHIFFLSLQSYDLYVCLSKDTWSIWFVDSSLSWKPVLFEVMFTYHFQEKKNKKKHCISMFIKCVVDSYLEGYKEGSPHDLIAFFKHQKLSLDFGEKWMNGSWLVNGYNLDSYLNIIC